MKKYEAPSLKETLFKAEDVIAVSTIISSDDLSGAAETQESSWDDSWN